MATYGLTANEHAAAQPVAVEAAKERSEVWLDAARILSVIAVVMLHASAPLTWDFGNQANWWVGNVFNSAGRWCVPVFVMVSGALLLDPSRSGGVLSFYRKRIGRVGLPLLAWTLVYLGWVELRSSSPPSLTGDIIGVVEGRPYYHLWFLYMLVGLYVLTPILRRFTATVTRRELRVVVAALLALGVADSFARFVLHVGQPNALTLFVPYVGYYLGGYLVRGFEKPRPDQAPWLVAAFVAAVAATAVTGFLLYRAGDQGAGDYMGDYLSPTTAVASFAFFMLLAAVIPGSWVARHPVASRAITFAGVASFGVYLIHPMILEAVPKLLGLSVASGIPAVSLISIIALVVALSLAVTALVRMVPGLKSLV